VHLVGFYYKNDTTNRSGHAVFHRSNTRLVFSNPTCGMDVSKLKALSHLWTAPSKTARSAFSYLYTNASTPNPVSIYF
jgi:hypothetical protein